MSAQPIVGSAIASKTGATFSDSAIVGRHGGVNAQPAMLGASMASIPQAAMTGNALTTESAVDASILFGAGVYWAADNVGGRIVISYAPGLSRKPKSPTVGG